jgi:Na+/H+ antiporter NhaD/arsenite permease-like protein
MMIETMSPLSHFGQLGGWGRLLNSAPFAGLLLMIAILPLHSRTAHWWESWRNKIVVSVGAALAGVLLYVIPTRNVSGLAHTLTEYLAFLALIGSLYIISGGIHIRGAFAGFPYVNTAFLAIGAVLANVLGTTGASMLLIRPFLRANAHRKQKQHQVVFFIFVVSNCGGLLTPLGDPPLFLGFLRGVPFAWTLRFFPHWSLVIGLLLAIFHILDERAFLKEDLATRENLVDEAASSAKRIHIDGRRNFVWLAGVLGTTLIAGYLLAPLLHRWCGESASLWGSLFQAIVLGGLALVSYRTTPRWIHESNNFHFDPVFEVAVLFFGIFGAMLPVLAILEAVGPTLGITKPWQYFWIAGSLSSFLDNAPTYLTFSTLAASTLGFGSSGLHALALKAPNLLAAVGCGSVFMGANTYIGNGPNFMVKAIADHRGIKTPGFFGYMAWSALVLLPVFVIVTIVFF